jgi:hypothetical protein
MPGLSMAQPKGRETNLAEKERAPGLAEPETREAILGGRQPAEFTLPALMDVFPMEWARHRMTFNWAHREATYLTKSFGVVTFCIWGATMPSGTISTPTHLVKTSHVGRMADCP